MHERESPNHDDTIDLIQLHTDLLPRIHLYTTPDAVAVYQLMQTLPGRINAVECESLVRDLLDQAVTEHTITTKNQFCAQVERSYPAGSENDATIESPKQFIKRNGLDGRIRPEIRQAQADAVSASRKQLVATIRGDSYHETFPCGISDEELEEKVKSKTRELACEVNDLAQQIKDMIPEHQVPVGRVGAGVLRAMQYGDVASVTALSLPETNRGLSLLDNAIFGLKRALTNLHNGEEFIAKTISSELAPAALDELRCQLDRHYEELETEERGRLPAMVDTAYAMAAQLGPRYKPKAVLPVDEALSIEATVLLSAEQRGENTISTKIEELGEIKNPFAWHSGDTVQLRLLRTNGDTLLACSAMSDTGNDISQKIREESAGAKKLDDLWTRVQETELRKHASQHSLIKGIQQANFHNLSILYFTNHQHNGLRTYYTKLKGSQFPSIHEAAEAAGASRDTDVVVLLAETDKAHQDKVLQEFTGLQ
jgi:hypothetical protein